MDCPQCSTALPDGVDACPECGAPLEYRSLPRRRDRRKKKHTGLVVGLLIAVLGLLGVLVAITAPYVLPGLRRGPASPAPSAATATGTTTPTSAEESAAAAAVERFYATVDAGEVAQVPALMTSETASTLSRSVFKGWTTPTVEVVRSVVVTGTASVYARETTRALGSSDRGVKFILRLVGSAWLIESWQPVDEGTLTEAAPSAAATAALALTDATSRDVVGTLLQARQQGDAGTIRMLTTAKFQKANPAWLDGVDNSQSFTSFAIVSAKQGRSTFVVSTRETWSGGSVDSAYTVVLKNQSILVDAWSKK
jgi:cytoskeletal protein RodZ